MAHVLAIIGVVLALELLVFPGMLVAWRFAFPEAVERARSRIDRTPWKCFLLGIVPALILAAIVIILVILPVEVTRIAGCSLLLVILAFAGLGAAGLAAQAGGAAAMRDSTPHGPFARMPGRFLLELAACLWLGAVATAIVLPAMAVLLALPMELKWLTASSLFFAAFAVVTTWLLRARTAASEKRGYSGTRPSFSRGVLTLELVGGFPLIGWFVALPIGFVVALGASMFAMLRWTPREPITAAPRAPG